MSTQTARPDCGPGSRRCARVRPQARPFRTARSVAAPAAAAPGDAAGALRRCQRFLTMERTAAANQRKRLSPSPMPWCPPTPALPSLCQTARRERAATVAKTSADAPRTVRPRAAAAGGRRADKCIPCKAMALSRGASRRIRAQLRVDFIDAWKYPDQAVPFNVYGIPTQIFFDPSGRELFRHVASSPRRRSCPRGGGSAFPDPGKG